jgi:predicted phosphodiesterase
MHTVNKWVLQIRKGQWDGIFEANDLDLIAQSIGENAQVARGAFRPEPSVQLDIDPLAVLEKEIDIKSIMFDVPESYADYRAPLKLDSYGSRLGVISDIHFPIHDRPAVLAAHSLLKAKKIDCLLLLGDIMDCSNLTRHAMRRQLPYTWREECEVGRAYIKSLRVLFPSIPIVYAFGNHESWFQQYIIRNARDLQGDYVLKDRLGLAEYNIEYVEEDRLMTYGHLYLHHGHRLGIGGGANIPARLLSKHGVNMMIGHFHHGTTDDKRTLDGEVHGAWVNGCLSDLHPDYNPHNNSTHGCSIIQLLDGGRFHVTQYKIINGVVLGE